MVNQQFTAKKRSCYERKNCLFDDLYVRGGFWRARRLRVRRGLIQYVKGNLNNFFGAKNRGQLDRMLSGWYMGISKDLVSGTWVGGGLTLPYTLEAGLREQEDVRTLFGLKFMEKSLCLMVGLGYTIRCFPRQSAHLALNKICRCYEKKVSDSQILFDAKEKRAFKKY